MPARLYRSLFIARFLPLVCAATLFSIEPVEAQTTAKPILHGKHWVAITGKPLGATAGARRS